MSEEERTEKRTPRKLRTLAVHAGEPNPPVGGAISMPIFQSSTYLLEDAQDFHDIRYIRLNNTPGQVALAAKLAALEGAEAAVVTSSGTAAVSISLFSQLEPGDHMLVQDRIYGGTRKVVDQLVRRQGVRVDFVPGDDPDAWHKSLTPRTKLIYVESLTNPLLEIAALDEVVRFARAHRLLSVIDNTFASPMMFRPVPFGFDLVIHSASKYLNGHSDVVAGVVAGGATQVDHVRKQLNLMGVCLDPHACFLMQRGLKTLPLRVPAQQTTAAKLARALVEHRAVRKVHYPGLPSDPGHARARAWFDGFGAMVSFVPVGGGAAATRVVERLQIAQEAPSLGGIETLVCRPVATSHAGLTDKVRLAMGVTDDIVRVSVGIEDADDLIDDFHHALGAVD